MSEPTEEPKTTTVLKKYYAPTPKKWRKLGDSILVLSVGLQPLTQTLPLTDNQRVWIGFAMGGIGLLGKVITNFFTEEAD